MRNAKFNDMYTRIQINPKSFGFSKEDTTPADQAAAFVNLKYPNTVLANAINNVN